MKKPFFYFPLMLVTSLFAVSCSSDDDPDPKPDPSGLTSIAFNPTTLSMTVGESQKLSVVTDPSNYTGDMTFASSDETVATISSKGSVTAIAEGTATMTVTAGELSGNCVVTVISATGYYDNLEFSDMVILGGLDIQINDSVYELYNSLLGGDLYINSESSLDGTGTLIQFPTLMKYDGTYVYPWLFVRDNGYKYELVDQAIYAASAVAGQDASSLYGKSSAGSYDDDMYATFITLGIAGDDTYTDYGEYALGATMSDRGQNDDGEPEAWYQGSPKSGYYVYDTLAHGTLMDYDFMCDVNNGAGIISDDFSYNLKTVHYEVGDTFSDGSEVTEAGDYYVVNEETGYYTTLGQRSIQYKSVYAATSRQNVRKSSRFDYHVTMVNGQRGVKYSEIVTVQALNSAIINSYKK